ncbi:MAG: PT domain-containing protein [Christensenella sp.]|nr:PT domain-containing protein [Christensenella sp.]
MNKKKKVVLSIMLAVMLVMVVSVTAFAAAPSVSISNTSPKTGDTVTFTIKCSENVAGIQGAISTSGLQYISKVTNPSGMGSETMLITLGNTASYTYKVTAAAGEQVSFSLANVITSDAEGNETTETGVFAAAATVVTPTEPTAEPTAEPTVQPTAEPTAQPTVNPSASASATADSLDDVPKTGDTTTDVMLFVMIGIVAAAAIMIVAVKKVSANK